MIIRISALSALGSREQDAALAGLAQHRPRLVVIRYTQQPGPEVATPSAEREVSQHGLHLDTSQITAPTGCLSCAIVDDLSRLLPELAGTDWARDILVVLPLGVSAHTVLDGCAAIDPASLAPLGLTIGTVAVALDAVALEDQLWAAETLADAHIAVAEDDLSLGEFLVGELLLADTYVLANPSDEPGLEVISEDVIAGIELARHIAPQSRATAVGGGLLARFSRPELADTFDEDEAQVRSELGAVAVPVRSTGEVIASHVVRIERPLHPGRLAVAMHTIAAGCVWSRGFLWVASMPARRVGWIGVGPNVSFGDAGGWLADGAERFRLDSLALLTWHTEYGDRGSMLAFTARELDAAGIETALQACALTDAELALGLEHWSTQPDPLELRSSFDHVHELDNEPHHEKE